MSLRTVRSEKSKWFPRTSDGGDGLGSDTHNKAPYRPLTNDRKPVTRNMDSVARRIGPSSHGGSGEIEHFRVFEGDSFDTQLCLVAADVIPPGSSIAEHQHIHDEELYVVLEGKGTITLDGRDEPVGPGDIILTTMGHSHGIRNDSDQPLKILVVEASIPTDESEE